MKISQKRIRCAAAVIAIISEVACTYCNAAEFRSFTSKDGKVLISLIGEISDGDAVKFKEQIELANAKKQYVANIRLASPGGSLAEGVKLAEAVRYASIATNVGKNAVCASACFLVFAAGSTKYANYTARIGVHGASTKDGDQAGDATISMGRVAKDLGVPPAIIGRMVITPPSEMVWLTPSELQSMGTSMVGQPSQVPPPDNNTPLSLEPSVPQQTAPVARLPQNSKSEWDNIVNNAIELSAKQNGGRARSQRICQPETKTCSTALMYKTDKGADVMVVRREDANGRAVERELCIFNSYSDVRDCYNVDTHLSHKDMKDSRGNWTEVEH